MWPESRKGKVKIWTHLYKGVLMNAHGKMNCTDQFQFYFILNDIARIFRFLFQKQLWVKAVFINQIQDFFNLRQIRQGKNKQGPLSFTDRIRINLFLKMYAIFCTSLGENYFLSLNLKTMFCKVNSFLPILKNKCTNSRLNI